MRIHEPSREGSFATPGGLAGAQDVFTFLAMKELLSPTELLGYVELHIGAKKFTLPVEGAEFSTRDGAGFPGGFFAHGDSLGILVDRSRAPVEQKEMVEQASLDAVQYLTRMNMN